MEGTTLQIINELIEQGYTVSISKLSKSNLIEAAGVTTKHGLIQDRYAQAETIGEAVALLHYVYHLEAEERI